MLYILLGLAVLLLIAYLGLLFFQRRYANRANAIAVEKSELKIDDIKKRLADARNLSLTGNSLRDYQNLESSFNELVNTKFQTLDELISSVDFSSKTLNVFKTRREAADLEQVYSDVEEKVHSIEEGIDRLYRLDNERKEAITDLRKEYDSLRKRILSESFKFGPAADGLEAELSHLEGDYAKFVELTNAGDHSSATDIYEQLRIETNQLKEKIIQVPELWEKQTEEFPKQIQEIKEGADQLSKRGFDFAMDIPKAFNNIELSNQIINDDFKNVDIKKITDDQGILEQQIGTVYRAIEDEYGAEFDVKKNDTSLTQMLERVRTQNNELQMQLDQLGQEFVLEHNQIEDAKQWGNRISEQQKNISNIRQRQSSNKRTYTEIRDEQEKVLLDLNQISNDQVNLYKTIVTYPQIAADLKKTAADSLNTFNRIKATIDRLSLPGVSPDYKLAYINTKESIERFAENVNAPRIDLDDAQRQAMQTTSDLDDFKQISTNVYLYSNLAQQSIRYLTRYQQNPAIADTHQRATALYEKDFNYEYAAEEAGRAIEAMEPGRYQQMKRDLQERSIAPFN